MTRFWSLLMVLVLGGLSPSPVWSQEAKPEAKEKEKEKEKDKDKPRTLEDETPVVTHHEVTIGGKRLPYTATAGMMPLRDAEGKTESADFLHGVYARWRQGYVQASADVFI